MTYPVGGLPDQGFIANNFIVPFKSVVFTHGGSDMDLTDEATNGLYPCARSLYITVSGNIVARLAGDTTERTYAVTAGQELAGIFVLLKSTSTADCIARQ